MAATLYRLTEGDRKSQSFDARLISPKAQNSDARCDAPFQRLGEKGRAYTFAGDGMSLDMLRRRMTRSNFAPLSGLRDLRRAADQGGACSSFSSAWRRPRNESFSEAHGLQCVVVVDAFSTGACLAYEASQRGFSIIHVLSFEPSPELAKMVPAELRDILQWEAQLSIDTSLPLDAAARKLAPVLRRAVETCSSSDDDEAQSSGRELVAVIAGAETGVKLADLLSEVVLNQGWAPQVRTNGGAGAEQRRNKWDMGEAVRAAGVRAVRQLQTATWPPVEAWLAQDWGIDVADENKPIEPMIVKPLESAGSDGVTACASVADLKRALKMLVGQKNGLGQVNEGVLVQEFLQGREFVVDAVCRDGLCKVLGLWAYDRRPTNGAGFVLHGQRFMHGGEPEVATLVTYAEKVLRALNVVHGPSHMEIKLHPTTGAPCLVEVGARCHGAEGFWISIAKSCNRGLNQADAALEAYLPDPAPFDDLPALPLDTLENSGCIRYLLVHRAGRLASVNPEALAILKSLASYTGHEIFISAGDDVIPTQNCFSWGGCVKLVHPDAQQMWDDYATIEAMCRGDPGYLPLWVID